MRMSKLSVIIHTYNSERYLKYVLESVKFADEIIIADMGSTDKTIEIAKRYKCSIKNIKKLKFADPARAKIYKEAKGDFVLVLDSDEVLSNTLQKSILEILEKNDKSIVYNIPRVNWLLGTATLPTKKGRGAFDRQIRLSPRNSLKYTGKVHEQPVLKNNYKLINLEINKGHIEHFSHVGSSDLFMRGDVYARLEAERIIEKNKKPSSQLLHFILFFIKFIKSGNYKFGFKSFLIFYSELTYRINVLIKLYEIKHHDEEKVLKKYFTYLKNQEKSAKE